MGDLHVEDLKERRNMLAEFMVQRPKRPMDAELTAIEKTLAEWSEAAEEVGSIRVTLILNFGKSRERALMPLIDEEKDKGRGTLGLMVWCFEKMHGEITTLAAEKEVMKKALKLVYDMAGHNHWDNTMQHGAGCPLCIKQREIIQKIEGMFAESERRQQPEPQGVSA